MLRYRITICVFMLFAFAISSYAQYIEPTPISGTKVFKTFIKKHLDYPEKDLQNNIDGKVKIEFTTDKTGKVSNYSISENVSPSIDSAAVSIFNLILWNPATMDGKPIVGTSEFDLKYSPKPYLKLTKRRGYNHINFPHYPIDTSGIIFTTKQTDTAPKAILSKQYSSISEYIYRNLTYPEAAIKLGLTGDVEVKFIVEANGLPSNIVATKHLGGGCTEEGIRIIESIVWYPGIINNEAVRTQYKLTIHFKRSDSKDGHIPNQQGSGI